MEGCQPVSAPDHLVVHRAPLSVQTNLHYPRGIRRFFKLARFPKDPAEPVGARATQPKVKKAFCTYGIVSPLSHPIPVRIGLDTYAEADLVDIKLVRRLGLKQCRNKNLPILRAVNQQDVPTYGVYNLRVSLTDSYGLERTTLRPYIAIDRDPGDSQILLGMPALTDARILLDCEAYTWQYQITSQDVRVESLQRFQKRIRQE
jgi:hypothetical protein